MVSEAQDLWNAEFFFLPGPKPLLSAIKKPTIRYHTLHDIEPA
jgi:hypothetical protein